jgi:hypothetical protein
MPSQPNHSAKAHDGSTPPACGLPFLVSWTWVHLSEVSLLGVQSSQFEVRVLREVFLFRVLHGDIAEHLREV